jgi:cellulose synthase (UDP-forming)
MVRVAGLRAIGGLPTESVTEDFLLTLRLSENGWRTVYLNEPLTEGLAPEGLQEYIVQRGRWCLGMMEIVRKVYNPLGTHGLSLMQRLSVLDSFLFWTTTFPFRLLSLVGPLLYWYLGIIVVDAPLADVISYYLPYYIASLVALNWISGGLLIPILNDISQLLAAWPIMRAVALGLFTKGPHKFRVTAKGGDRTRTVMQWPIARPFALLFGLTVLGLTLPVFVDAGFTHTATAGDGIRIVLFWSVYNLTVLAVAMLACIERPRANRPLRSPIELALLSVNGREFRSWVLDLGVDQARVRGPYGLAGGEKGTIELGGVGNVAAAVSGIFADGYRLDLKPTEEQRAQLLRKIHAAHAAPGTTRGDLGIMIRGWMRSLNSQ